jgi:hypothetical protein
VEPFALAITLQFACASFLRVQEPKIVMDEVEIAGLVEAAAKEVAAEVALEQQGALVRELPGPETAVFGV